MRKPSPHDSDPENSGTSALAFSLFVLIAFLVVAGSLLEAQVKYGDWRCAYRRCVVVVQPKHGR